MDAPLPSLGRRARIRGRWRQHSDRFEATREIANLISNAEAIGVAVTWANGPVRLGGYVYRPATETGFGRDIRRPPPQLDPMSLPVVVVGGAVVVLNERQSWTTTFDVLLHELAHVLLGHLKEWAPLRQHRMRVADRSSVPVAAAEVEALATGHLAALWRGSIPQGIGPQLVSRFMATFSRKELAHVDLLQVVCVADVLAAWCAEPPDSVSVLREDGTSPEPDLRDVLRYIRAWSGRSDVWGREDEREEEKLLERLRRGLATHD